MEITLSEKDLDALAKRVAPLLREQIVKDAAMNAHYEESVKIALERARNLFDPKFMQIDAVEKYFEDLITRFSKEILTQIVEQQVDKAFHDGKLDETVRDRIFRKIERLHQAMREINDD